MIRRLEDFPETLHGNETLPRSYTLFRDLYDTLLAKLKELEGPQVPLWAQTLRDFDASSPI